MKLLFNLLLAIAMFAGVAYFFSEEILGFVKQLPPKQLQSTLAIIGLLMVVFVIELSKKPAKKD